MVSVLTFSLIFLQTALSIAAHTFGWKTCFSIVFIHISPIMVFFSGLQTLLNYTGSFPPLLFPALFYCVMKYTLIAIALKNEPLGFFNVGALLMEVAYIAISGIYIVYYHYS